MKNKITALLMAAALSLSLAGTAFAFDPPPSGQTTPSTDGNGNITWEIKDPTTPGGNGGGSSSGGGDYYVPPADPTYSVSASANAGGTVSTDKTNAKKGDTVTITVTPNDGYRVDGLTVKDAKGNDITVTDLGGGKYSFIMPDGKVSIAAKFVTGTVTSPFVDVNQGDYFYDAVLWAVSKGITNGTSANQFSPNLTCTRAQTVTFLWRAAGSPAPQSTTNPFTDVAPGAYYYNAVLWAVENGVTNGTSADKFSPDGTVTRGQTVTFMFRAAKAQAAEGNNPFVDVAAGEYYADAVQWAVSRNITNGTSATTFGPGEGCTRGQIVTFLYRAK